VCAAKGQGELTHIKRLGSVAQTQMLQKTRGIESPWAQAVGEELGGSRPSKKSKALTL
jgi:hypothetical protein